MIKYFVTKLEFSFDMSKRFSSFFEQSFN